MNILKALAVSDCDYLRSIPAGPLYDKRNLRLKSVCVRLEMVDYKTPKRMMYLQKNTSNKYMM